MKNGIIGIFILLCYSTVMAGEYPDVRMILQKIDQSQNVERQIIESSMVIHSIRGSRQIKYKSWIIGKNRSFTESLAPAREKGTKMLKMNQDLWIYNPRADRIIKVAGHMLRQSMSGSDLSYEDMMEKGKLLDNYDAKIIGEEKIRNREVWVMELKAKTEDIAYQGRKIWIDKERFIPLKEEQFAASGKILKRLEIKEVFKTSRGWYPRTILFKDVLKKGKGTEFHVHHVDFDVRIPKSKFSKAALRR